LTGLAVVVAHPDDDTFGCAGTVALHAGEVGFRFVLVHATSGEQGQIADASLATPETLGRVREQEDRRSWIELGREPDRHEWLRLPDGGVADEPFDDLVDRITAVLLDERPDVVITFGPDGITGHPDHIAVGRAASEAFHRSRARLREGHRRLLHAALRASSIAAWNQRLVERGLEPIDSTQLYQPRGVPDETIGVDVDCGPVLERKIAALRAHATQAAETADWSERDLREGLARETHVVAWPPRSLGSPVLRDPLDDL
jgi:N-acetyl-1-D-myo-inositol-2-amino-2-deoxy-alpha-D-glucopyranoside deacetylase